MDIILKNFVLIIGRRPERPPFGGAVKWRLLKSKKIGCDEFRLVAVLSFAGFYTTYHVQHRELGAKEWHFIRTIRNENVEYARKKAIEIFNAITTEI